MPQIAYQVYPRPIRILHWTIVGLIALQLLSADFMEAFFRRVEDQPVGILPDNAGALMHAAGGVLILILMAARFLMRLKLGTPPIPRDLAPPLRILARLNHFAFYVVLVLLPLSGASAVFFAREFGDIHETLVIVLFVIIGLHLAGVAFHMIVLRDGLLWRMLAIRRR
jgi:cytochrome b561